jgi:hypothetical protein
LFGTVIQYAYYRTFNFSFGQCLCLIGSEFEQTESGLAGVRIDFVVENIEKQKCQRAANPFCAFTVKHKV